MYENVYISNVFIGKPINTEYRSWREKQCALDCRQNLVVTINNIIIHSYSFSLPITFPLPFRTSKTFLTRKISFRILFSRVLIFFRLCIKKNQTYRNDLKKFQFNHNSMSCLNLKSYLCTYRLWGA